MKCEMYKETKALNEGYDRTRKQLKRVELNCKGIEGYYVVGRIQSHAHNANNSIHYKGDIGYCPVLAIQT